MITSRAPRTLGLPLKFLWVLSLILLSVVLYILHSSAAHADPLYTFSGILKDQNGNAIRGVLIELRDTQNNFVNDQTNADGSFSIAASPKMYSLKVYTSSPVNQSGLGHFSLAQPLSTPTIDLTSADFTQDLTLPVATVNFTLYNAQGYGTSNATVTAGVAQSNAASATLYSGAPESVPDRGWGSNTITPSGNGTGVFKTIVGTNYPVGSISIRWKSTGQHSGNAYSITTVDGTNNIDLPNTPPPKHTFSGVFKDSTGSAIPNAQFKLQDAYNNTVTGTTNSTGHFNLAVRPGMYSLNIIVSVGTVNNRLGSFQLAQSVANPSIDLTAENVAQDLTLPVGTVNYTAYNAQGGITSYIKVKAISASSTTPISLFTGGADFQLPIGTSHNLQSDAWGTGYFKAIAGVTYQGSGSANGICSYLSSGTLMNCNTAPLTVLEGANNVVINPRIATPTGLSIVTPTPLPNLNWQPVTNADQYFIYRNNVKIATSSTSSFTDHVGNGTYDYQVSAVDANGVESFLSSKKSVVVTQISPTLDTPTFSANPVLLGQPTAATVNVIGNLHGVSDGEYFVGDIDPGQGNGSAMSYSNGVLTANLSGLAVGNHTINFRAKNNVGWGQPVAASLSVIKPTFSGTLKDQNGNAIRGVLVELRDTQNNFVNDQTAADGSFSVQVMPGLYSLKVYTSSPVNQSGLGQFSLAQPLSTPSIDLTAGNVVQDLTLPVATVDFTLYNAQGYGTSDGVVSAGVTQANAASATLYPGALESTPTGGWTSNSITPDSHGVDHFKTIVGTNYPAGAISIRWKSTGQYSSNAYSLTAIDGYNHIDLPNTPQPNNTFSGTLKDSDNTPLGSVELTLTDAYNNFVNATTNSSGAYSIAVRPGLYSLKIEGDNIPGIVDFNLEHTPITPSIDLSSGSVSQDLVVPVGIIDVTTYNAQGNTFAYPRIKAYTGLINSPISLAASNYDFNVTGGNYRLYSGNLGVGSFKSIVGMSYTGAGSSNTICSYDDMSSVTPITCSPPFTVMTGVNSITLNQVPTP